MKKTWGKRNRSNDCCTCAKLILNWDSDRAITSETVTAFSFHRSKETICKKLIIWKFWYLRCRDVLGFFSELEAQWCWCTIHLVLKWPQLEPISRCAKTLLNYYLCAYCESSCQKYVPVCMQPKWQIKKNKHGICALKTIDKASASQY